VSLLLGTTARVLLKVPAQKMWLTLLKVHAYRLQAGKTCCTDDDMMSIEQGGFHKN